jgi:hypothetical protein
MNHMKTIKLLMAMFMFASASLAAFEFNTTNAAYDFTQTVDIFIVDKKGSKFFGMVDPFEMKMTTMPSRFYFAVLGAIERGHKNADGVASVDGVVSDYIYAVMFRSLDRSHILLVGENWIVDGNKKIFLLPEEISGIYEILKGRSNELPADDLSKWEPLLKEINEQQGDATENGADAADTELKSIAEARKSIQARLPAGHNDVQNLPYYNKALQNEQFREQQEKLKKTQDGKKSIDFKLSQRDEITQPAVTLAESSSPVASAPSGKQNVTAPDTAPANASSFVLLSIFTFVSGGLLFWRRSKRGLLLRR